LHHQAAGYGNGPGDQPHHRGAAPRPALGRAPGVRGRHHGATAPARGVDLRNGVAVDMTAVPTVFVVDDNPGVRKSLQALVEAEGLAVAAYASAAEFLEAWDARRPGC